MAGKGVLIVVPARGGSKGLPRKNARQLAGLPLLGWTAEAVRAAALEDALCLLSTDDPEIAEIGRSLGLEAPFVRPAELATDEASAEAVALHALDWVCAHRRMDPAAVMLLQPTSPFRPPSALRDAVSILSDSGCSAVIGVKVLFRSLRTLFHANGVMELTALDSGGTLHSSRQALRPLFTPNGALYLVSAAALRASGGFVPARCRGIPMDQIASLDIDDPVDWAIAEAVAAEGLTWRGVLPR